MDGTESNREDENFFVCLTIQIPTLQYYEHRMEVLQIPLLFYLPFCLLRYTVLQLLTT